jgi:hypothetical protein
MPTIGFADFEVETRNPRSGLKDFGKAAGSDQDLASGLEERKGGPQHYCCTNEPRTSFLDQRGNSRQNDRLGIASDNHYADDSGTLAT